MQAQEKASTLQAQRNVHQPLTLISVSQMSNTARFLYHIVSAEESLPVVHIEAKIIEGPDVGSRVGSKSGPNFQIRAVGAFEHGGCLTVSRICSVLGCNIFGDGYASCFLLRTKSICSARRRTDRSVGDVIGNGNHRIVIILVHVFFFARRSNLCAARRRRAIDSVSPSEVQLSWEHRGRRCKV